jgi:hypothetical protein
MGNCTTLALAAAAALLMWSQSVFAQAGDPSACVTIESDLQRLACFDAAFATDPEPDPAVKICETLVIGSLRSPSSYKRIAARVASNTVSIEYDASNGFGAIVREFASCPFWKLNGKIRLKVPDFYAQDIALWTTVRKLLGGVAIDPAQTAVRPSLVDNGYAGCIEAAAAANDIGSVEAEDFFDAGDQAGHVQLVFGTLRTEVRVAQIDCDIEGGTVTVTNVELRD